jgi:hypothetical protein
MRTLFCVSYVPLDQKNKYACRASPSEFVIPLSKYIKAVFHTRISVGMRFRMLFETEESSVRRCGSNTKISLWFLGKKLSMQPEHFFFSCTWWWNVFKLCETMCPWECQFHAQCLWKKLIKKILNNCRYMGTITEVSDADPVRWPSSYWRSVKVRVFSSWFFLVSFLLLLLAGSLYDLTLFFLPADFYTDHRFILWEVKLS